MCKVVLKKKKKKKVSLVRKRERERERESLNCVTQMESVGRWLMAKVDKD